MTYKSPSVPGVHAYPTGLDRWGLVAPQVESPHVQHPATSGDTEGQFWAGYTAGYPQGHALFQQNSGHVQGAMPRPPTGLYKQLQAAGFTQAYINGFATGFNDGAVGNCNRAQSAGHVCPAHLQPPAQTGAVPTGWPGGHIY